MITISMIAKKKNIVKNIIRRDTTITRSMRVIVIPRKKASKIPRRSTIF